MNGIKSTLAGIAALTATIPTGCIRTPETGSECSSETIEAHALDETEIPPELRCVLTTYTILLSEYKLCDEDPETGETSPSIVTYSDQICVKTELFDEGDTCGGQSMGDSMISAGVDRLTEEKVGGVGEFFLVNWDGIVCLTTVAVEAEGEIIELPTEEGLAWDACLETGGNVSEAVEQMNEEGGEICHEN